MTVQRIRRLLAPLVALCLLAGAAEAKSYSAERFDVRIVVLPGGAIEVLETVVFRFEDGTFRYVFREIPRRYTDGIEILRATMDGRELPLGGGAGELEVRRKSRVHVRWNFAQPIAASPGPSVHTLTLLYRVHGVVRQSERGDLLAWRAIPGRHAYTIDASTIAIVHPEPIAGAPRIERRRVASVAAGEAQIEADAGTLRLTATGIRKNGWVEPWLTFAPGSLIAEAPAWQQAKRRADALGPWWLLGAAAIVLGDVLAFLMLWRRYDRAPRVDVPSGSVPAAPEPLPPALAGVLASNGTVSRHHAMAALFALADRGALVIEEEPRSRWTGREFTLRRAGTPHALPPHEQVVFDLAFTDKADPRDEVRLSKAASRIGSGLKRIRAAVHGELEAAGLLDRTRQAARTQFGALAGAIVIAGALLFIGAGVLSREYGAWPLLIPGAFLVSGVIGFFFQGAATPLSNEGVHRAARWRAYQQHLKEVTRSRAHLAAESPARVLAYAVALGLGSAWAKYVKAHPAEVPKWFSAVSASSGSDGFAAFVAYTGAAGGTGGGAGAGGAAGGGASGAG